MRKTRTDGIVVPPKSTDAIAGIASRLRRLTELDNSPFFPIVDLYEHLHLIVEGASFEILIIEEMGEDHGRTYPDSNLIYVREDVMEGAFDDRPRDRFTLCHELGHLIMHRGVALSRVDPKSPPPIYRNSEWQADTFASHLLMPKSLLSRYDNIDAVIDDFGVSYEAANVRRKDLSNG